MLKMGTRRLYHRRRQQRSNLLLTNIRRTPNRTTIEAAEECVPGGAKRTTRTNYENTIHHDGDGDGDGDDVLDVGILSSSSSSCKSSYDKCIPNESSSKGGICVDTTTRILDDDDDDMLNGDYWYENCTYTIDENTGLGKESCIMCSDCRCYAFDSVYLDDGSSHYWACFHMYNNDQQQDDEELYSQICFQGTYQDDIDEIMDECRFFIDHVECDCIPKLCVDVAGKNERVTVDCSNTNAAAPSLSHIKYDGCYDKVHDSFPGSVICFDDTAKPDPLLFRKSLFDIGTDKVPIDDELPTPLSNSSDENNTHSPTLVTTTAITLSPQYFRGDGSGDGLNPGGIIVILIVLLIVLSFIIAEVKKNHCGGRSGGRLTAQTGPNDVVPSDNDKKEKG